MGQHAEPVHIIGGGLAGCEAAWQTATRGVAVVLHEMRPVRATPAHKSAALAELVCSNSLRSDDQEHNAVGLLHEEMRRLGSLILRSADANQVPGRRRACGRSRRLCGGRHNDALRASACRDPARRDCGAPAGRLGQRDHRNRAPHLARRSQMRSQSAPAKTRWLSSTRLPPSFTAIASICRSPGGNRATTRPGPADRAPTTSIARFRASNTTPSSTPCSAAEKVAFHEWEEARSLFRWLPAYRGDGRARARDPAPRPDETVRPDQPT